jgi:hypothetical protein
VSIARVKRQQPNEGSVDTCAKGADLDLALPPPFDAAVNWPVEAMPMLALSARFFLGCGLEYDQVR